MTESVWLYFYFGVQQSFHAGSEQLLRCSLGKLSHNLWHRYVWVYNCALFKMSAVLRNLKMRGNNRNQSNYKDKNQYTNNPIITNNTNPLKPTLKLTIQQRNDRTVDFWEDFLTFLPSLITVYDWSVKRQLIIHKTQKKKSQVTTYSALKEWYRR